MRVPGIGAGPLACRLRASTFARGATYGGPAAAFGEGGRAPSAPGTHRGVQSGRFMSALAEVLARETCEGELYDTLPDGRLRCYACGHCCPLPEGAIGVCKVRFNAGGRLRVPWGYVGGGQCDPIEKKPFFHAHPGALAYSSGMLGCDLHCAYCQNWVTSQALRDPAAVAPPLRTTPAGSGGP